MTETGRRAAAAHIVGRGDVEIEVLAQGRGHVIVLLPSLGRGATDFDPIAERLADAGFRVLRPQPRGIGRSRGPMTGIDLHDCAADVAAVIEHEDHGPAFVAGHAFGNRVARMLATDRPALVRAVSLVAANVGRTPSPPVVREAIKKSANPSLPDDERLQALQFAFFAPGNDARGWLKGWHPEVLAAQRIAGDRTSREADYAGGGVPILYLQPDHDPLAHVEDAHEFRQALGERVTVEIVRHSSHAAIAEQPAAIANALIAYARKLWNMPRDIKDCKVWADYPDISLHYAVSGAGPRTLVLIHELAGTLESWDLVVPKLEPAFRILRADQRGAGQSEKVRAPFGLDDLVTDTERLLRTSGLEPPYYVAGIASGAAIAVALALRRPHDVAALALCAPSLQTNPDRRHYLLDRSETARRDGMRAIIDVVFERTYPKDAIGDPEVYAEHRARFLAIDPVCYGHANRMLSEVALEPSLSSVACPCLLLAGRHDQMRPPDQVKSYAERFKQAEFDLVDSGHIMVVQAPDAVASKMKAFFLKH
jgi:pimeloyl-ACP methyl ester carboxylesterase